MEHEVLLKMIDCLNNGRKGLSDIDLEVNEKAVLGIDKIIERVSSPLMIMVMGEFSTGKSTFINALVGKEVTAVNATPTTAVITKICYGNKDKITVHFINGIEKEFESEEFKQLTSKTGKSDEDSTHANIEYVERQLPLEVLKYVTIIDSPGLNDINEKHSEATKKFVHNSDTVFWLFSALQSGSNTEVASMETLSPRLKPIAIINKMDEIDEEEDNPEEFLDNLRIQLKDKVQAVIGISAKYALEGKLEDDSVKIEIGNFKEIEKAIRTLVFPNRDILKLNSLMDDLGEWIDVAASDIKEAENNNKENQDTDYSKYLEIKAKLQQNREILVRIVDGIKDYTVTASQKYNEQAMYLLGVLSKYGIDVQQDDENAEQYLEGAAIKNHLLACTCLADFYIEKDQSDKAFVWLKKAADQNVATAQYFVGLCYRNGVGTREDTSSALFYLKRSAKQGNADAQFELANCYYEGYGVEENDEEALFWYEKSAKQGHAEAQYELANCYKNGIGCAVDIKEATNWYLKAAKQGIAEAQFRIAENYRTGDYLAKDYISMISWYRKAAEQGHTEAQNWLGRFYEEGWGTEKNLEKAVFWYQKAADQNYAVAQHNLAVCYENGYGVPKNVKKAFVWYKRAAENGEVISQATIGHAYRIGFVVEQNDNESFDWFEKAAKQGNADAQSWLGYCYQYGIGIEQNEKEAFAWYKKAAEKGEVSAQIRLAFCYEKGIGIARNENLAVQIYKKVADDGYADAQYDIGRCCNEGIGVEKDRKIASDWFKLAAEQGNTSAQFALYELYEEGVLKEDKEIAEKWLEQSANNGNPAAQLKIGYLYGYKTWKGEKNEKKAFYWYKRAAEQGFADAEYALGVCLKSGYGTEKDEREGCIWIGKAANKDFAAAQWAYGMSFENGIGIEKDEKQAFYWYKKGAENGDKLAQLQLGNCFENNIGTEKDEALAFYWYKQAAEGGLPEAQRNLAHCYNSGIGVDENLEKALYWYKQAAEQGNEEAKQIIDHYEAALNNDNASNANSSNDGCGCLSIIGAFLVLFVLRAAVWAGGIGGLILIIVVYFLYCYAKENANNQ